nr:sugar ABC transporter permease [Sporosarcina sp. NCCP-2716]
MLYLLPSIVLFAVFLFYPMFKTIYLSLFLTDAQGNAQIFVGLEHYSQLLSSPSFRASLKATVLFVLYTVPAGVILALGLALLANQKLKGIGFFRTLFSSTMGMSVAASSVIWLFIYNPAIGIANTIMTTLGLQEMQWLLNPDTALISVAIPTIWMNTGFSFLILLGGLHNIDASLYESGKIAGVSDFYSLRKITLPLLSPTLLFIVTVSLINSFQTFGQIDILTKGGPMESTNVIVYSIFKDAFVNFNIGSASAQAVLLFAFILIVTILQFKWSEKKVHYQ